MIFLVFDNPADEKKMFFLNEYATKEFIQIYPQRKLANVKEMIFFVYNLVKNSTPNDILVFWFDFMGIICWWICKLFLKKRQIIILNILLKDKRTIKNGVAKLLYKKALNNDMVQVTVTSKEYGKKLNEFLKIDKDYSLLHDIYFGDKKRHNCNSLNYVFCGGRNGRDWKSLFDIAVLLPEIDFCCVIPKSIFSLFSEYIPQNVKVHCDISEIEYIELLSHSSIVVLPLDTDAPAGLITIFQAGMFNKLVITSNTPVTREYINTDTGVLCSSIDDWCKQIQYYLKHEEERKLMGNNFNRLLNMKCSKSNYAENLYKIVKEETNV